MRAARGEGAAREGARGGAGGESAPGAAAPAALPFARLRSRRRPASPPFPRGGLLSSSSRSPRPGLARGVASPGAFLCAPTSPRLSCAERSPCGRGAADPCLPCWPHCARSTRGTVGCRAARARCWIVPARLCPASLAAGLCFILTPPGSPRQHLPPPRFRGLRPPPPSLRSAVPPDPDRDCRPPRRSGGSRSGCAQPHVEERSARGGQRPAPTVPRDGRCAAVLRPWHRGAAGRREQRGEGARGEYVTLRATGGEGRLPGVQKGVCVG